MKYFLRGNVQPMQRYRNALPFSDWLAQVDRRIRARGGTIADRQAVSESYWNSLYHLGESSIHAADDFMQERRAR